MKSVWDFSVRGVWGEHSQFPNDMNYGGPECAEQYSWTFRFVWAVILVSQQLVHNSWFLIQLIPELFFLNIGLKLRNKDYPKRLAYLTKHDKLSPNAVEYLMGLALVATVIINCYYKYHTETMVFMLNPCHVVTACYIVMCFCKFNRLTEFLFVISIAFNFGG